VKARNLVAQFLEDMYNDRTPYCLTILGVPGVGKSFLAKLVDRFFQEFMCDRSDMRDNAISGNGNDWRMKGGLAEWGVALREMLDSGDYTRMGFYRNDYFLAIDDILAESSKLREMSATKLFDIIEARHARRWTILTANADIEGIERELDARISSRILRDENRRVTLRNVEDYAIHKAKSKK